MGKEKVSVLLLCWCDVLCSSLHLAVRSETNYNIEVHNKAVVDIT